MLMREPIVAQQVKEIHRQVVERNGPTMLARIGVMGAEPA
jgi:hypothetical protein